MTNLLTMMGVLAYAILVSRVASLGRCALCFYAKGSLVMPRVIVWKTNASLYVWRPASIYFSHVRLCVFLLLFEGKWYSVCNMKEGTVVSFGTDFNSDGALGYYGTVSLNSAGDPTMPRQ
jgi:hypothetical protein